MGGVGGCDEAETTVLNGRLELWDVRDVEQFCGHLIGNKWADLTPYEKEDLHAYLIATCWELSLRYRPGGISFSTWAGNTLRKRAIDWYRNERGRTRYVFKDRIIERDLPQFVSLDSELGGSEHRVAVDGTPDRSADLARFLRKGTSKAAWGDSPDGARVDDRTAA